MADGADSNITHAWISAGEQLGVRVIGPHQIGDAMYLAYLPDFGGPSGMVITPLKSPEETARAAAEAGMFLSRVSDTYAAGDLDLYRATLDDWGWYGPEANRPAWYSGRAWTN